MLPTQEVTKPSRGETWINIKRQTSYVIVSIATDATNDREGTPVVVYRAKTGTNIGDTSLGRQTPVYVRDMSEFTTNFYRKGTK